MALEPVRDKLGKWFINGGISEQNIVSMAAGMSKMGLQTWVYSIAPFIYARPFEQIRNDVCLNKLPVRLVGNGGGYAYGSMGSSHRDRRLWRDADFAGMNVYVPAFAEDVEDAVWRMAKLDQPAYLRLGRCENLKILFCHRTRRGDSWSKVMRKSSWPSVLWWAVISHLC